MNPMELCWQTGNYTDECICDCCEHNYECSASNNDEEELDDFDEIEEVAEELDDAEEVGEEEA